MTERTISWTDSQKRALNFHGIKDREFVDLCLWRGGSRSGKTFLAATLALKHALWFPGASILFTAQTITQINKTLERALIKVAAIIGVQLSKKKDREGGGDRYEFKNGSIIYMYPYEGAGVDRIIGAEYSLIIGDEFFRANIEKLGLLLTRLSGKGINKIIMLTNPQSTIHWLHKLVEPLENCLTYNFDVRENLGNLDNPHYLKTLERLPEHLRRRYLDGEPCDAYGQVYDNFDPGRNIITVLPNIPVKATIGGIDFGGTNPTAYWLLLVLQNDQVVVVNGYEMRETLLMLHAAKIKKINQAYPRTLVFADHDKQDRLELEYYKVFTEVAPKSDKNYNIGIMRELIDNGQLVFLSPDADLAITSICGYTWDDKKEDTPVKKDDHSHDAVIYALAGAYAWGLFTKWSVKDNFVRLCSR